MNYIFFHFLPTVYNERHYVLKALYGEWKTSLSPKNSVFLFIPNSILYLHYETPRCKSPHAGLQDVSQLGERATFSPFLQMTKQRLWKSKATDLDSNVS